MSEQVKPIPAGTMELPGYILEVFEGSAWMMRDGTVTLDWKERGVWDTEEEAKAAKREFIK